MAPKTDNHHAAVSGRQRELKLVSKFKEMGFTLVKTKGGCYKAKVPYEGTVKFEVNSEYAEAGFKYFLADGYCPELNCVVELKGGDKNGTTEEKLFFDLLKIQDGCYGEGNLIYIFEGKKQEDKCTRLFVKKLSQLHSEGKCLNVQVVMYDFLDKDLLQNLF